MGGIRPRNGARIRFRTAIRLLVAMSLLIAACGGSGDTISSIRDAAATSITSAPSGAQDSGGAPADQTFAVGEHFWHSGFRVEVVDGEITSTTNQISGEVTTVLALSATLENTGADSGYFGPSIVVTTSNNSYPSSFSNDIPDVPGGLKGRATFVFRIDEGFDLASAALLVGDADDNQAEISLRGGGGAIRLEPRQFVIQGELSMDLVDLVFSSAELRFDNPDRHREIENGKQALILHFDAVSRKSGNWQIFGTDLALILPDGTAVAPVASEIGSLPGSDDGVTTADRSVQFLVGDTPSGNYTLRLTPGSWFLEDGGATEATLEFTIE